MLTVPFFFFVQISTNVRVITQTTVRKSVSMPRGLSSVIVVLDTSAMLISVPVTVSGIFIQVYNTKL